MEPVKAKSPEMQSSGFSLAETVAESYQLGRLYTGYNGVKGIHGVELGFSQADKDGTLEPLHIYIGKWLVQGFIDLVIDLDGVGLTVIDHKTSKKEHTEWSVLYHEQLNFYAWVLSTMGGMDIKAIGISNARANTKTIVPWSKEIARQVMSRLHGELEQIERETSFHPQDPLEEYTGKKCLGFSTAPYTQPDHFKSLCPYLQLCHNELYLMIQDRIAAADGHPPAAPVYGPTLPPPVAAADPKRKTTGDTTLDNLVENMIG